MAGQAYPSTTLEVEATHRETPDFYMFNEREEGASAQYLAEPGKVSRVVNLILDCPKAVHYHLAICLSSAWRPMKKVLYGWLPIVLIWMRNLLCECLVRRRAKLRGSRHLIIFLLAVLPAAGPADSSSPEMIVGLVIGVMVVIGGGIAAFLIYRKFTGRPEAAAI